MRRHLLCGGNLVAWILVSAAAVAGVPAVSVPTAEIYAEWNEGSVTCGDFALWLEDKRATVNGPDDARSLLNQYAVTRVLAAAATEQGLGTGPLDEAVRRQREDVLYAALLQKSVVSDVSVGEEELDALVAQYPNAFVRPRRVRLFNLFKRVPTGSTAEERLNLRQEVEALRARAESGESFRDLASEHSDSETRLKGGLIGTVRPGNLVAALDAEVMALDAGAVSRVFESVDGFQIFFVERVHPEVRPTTEEVRSKLGGNLRKQRIDKAWAAIETSVVDSAGLGFFPERRDTPGSVLVSGEGLELTTVDLEADLSEVPVRGSFGPAAARVRLEFLATNRLLAAEARRRGIAPSQPELRSVEDRWTERLALLALGRRVENTLVRPSEQEVAAYFEEHAAEFELPREFELWAIRSSFDRGDLARQREASQNLRQAAAELRADASSFSQLAQRWSDLEGLSPPGYLGWVGERRLFSLSPNVRKAVDELSVGQLSESIREGDSYWLVRLSALREPRVPALREASEDAEDRLGQILADAARERIERALLEDLAIEIRGECETGRLASER